MALPNKSHKGTLHSVRSPALDQVTSEEGKIGIHAKARSKVVSPHRPKPPAPDRPPVAAKPKLKPPPPPPAKLLHSSSQSEPHQNAHPSLFTNKTQNGNEDVVSSQTEEKNINQEPSKEATGHKPDISPKPPSPLPNSPPCKTRIARSPSSSKVSPSKNCALNKSESQHSFPSSASASSNISVTSASQVSPISSPSHCPSATPSCTECTSPDLDINNAPAISKSNDSRPEDANAVSPSHDQPLSSDQSAIESKVNKATSPLEIQIPAEGAVQLGKPSHTLKGKTPPPVPRKSFQKDPTANNPNGLQSLSSPPSCSQSSPPTRPPPPSKPTPPLTHSRSISPHKSPSSHLAPVPQCHSATLGQQIEQNVTQASDAASRQTETDAGQTNSKSEPPPLPKQPPRRGLLKRQKSTASCDERSKSAPSQAPVDETQGSDDAEGVVTKRTQISCLTESKAQTGSVDNSSDKDSSKDCIVKVTNSDKENHSLTKESKSAENLLPCQPDTCGENSPICDSITENSNVTLREKVTPPRPVPRKRTSIPPSLTDSDLSNKTEDHQQLSDHSPHQAAKPEKEVEYAEVYVSPCKANGAQDNIAGKDTLNETQALIVKPDGGKTESNVSSKESQFSQNDSDVGGKSWDHGKSVSQDEPEPTCDMLKEIEELLSSKLSCIDIVSKSEPASANSNKDPGHNLEDTPKRPPRPKRDASRKKRKESLEGNRSLSVDTPGSQTLSSVDLHSTLRQDSDSARVPPQKPKRSTLPRVNRSLSDVSGMKDIFSCLDSTNPFSSNTSLNSESERPPLPPRSESLKRSCSNLSQSPPPLPPRNKPCPNSSPKTITQSAGPIMNDVNKSNGSSQESLKHSPAHSKTASLDQARAKEGLRAAGPSTGPRQHIKPRPARKAPPPPGLPKRVANFSQGDKSSVDSSERVKDGKWRRDGNSPEKSPRLPDDSSELPSPGLVEKLGNFFRAKSGESVRPRRTSVEPACLDISDEKRGTEGEGNESDASKTAEAGNAQNEKCKSASPGKGDDGKPSDNNETSSLKARPDSQSDVEGDRLDEEGSIGPNISSPSDSEEETAESEEIYQSKKKAKKIFNIAKEIASSESVFVDVLRLLNVDFRHHISKETEKYDQSIIPPEMLNRILQFLPQLQNLNEDLLKDVEQRISQWEESPHISDIFVKKGPFLKLYSSYISNFENAIAAMDEACKKHPRFASAVKEFEMGPRCAKLALKHYMLKPVQRIPQYKLLFTDYLRHLALDSEDFKPTQAALDIVSSVADHANESMRNWDNIQKLLEIQRNLIGQFEVIQPGRVLIKQGELMKLSRKEMQPRMFFLFSDVLLYTTPVTTGYKLNNILQLARMQVELPKVEENRYEINIIGKERSFTVCASTEEEKEDWLDALRKAIEQKIKSFESYKKHSETEDKSAGEESLLGQKAPVWVPDKRVTMCMLCLSEFTITWRRHHCRSCGKIVCKYCSGNMAPLPYLDNKLARVCDKCFGILNQDSKKEEAEMASGPEVASDDGSSNSAQEGEESRSGGQGSHTLDRNSVFGFNKMISSLFHKEKNGTRKKSNSSIPSVLKEVHANDEDSNVSGYLRTLKNHKWKKFWFLVKGNVIYTFQACEDRAAAESLPLLGYTVIEFTTAFEGVEPECLFELVHQNKQFIPSSMGSPQSGDKNLQRFIFRADSKASAEKWIHALKEASQA